MIGQVSLTAALAAGLISFLSPCVLPLLPGYVSFMTGMSITELRGEKRDPWRILGPVLLFVLGFTLVFVALGASASVLGSLLNANRLLLTRIAGVVVIFFGVVMLDVLPIPWFKGANIDAARVRRFGPWAALALGMVFPFACGPCAGPVYGAILTLAANTGSIGAGVVLLFVYSLGLALPFVAMSLLLGQLGGTLHWLTRHAKIINRFAGAVLVLMGIAMVTGLLEQAGVLLQRLPLIGG